MNMRIETYRDLLVVCLAAMWLIVNTVTFLACGISAVVFSNTSFVAVLAVLVIAMRVSPGFNRWLNRRI